MALTGSRSCVLRHYIYQLMWNIRLFQIIDLLRVLRQSAACQRAVRCHGNVILSSEFRSLPLFFPEDHLFIYNLHLPLSSFYSSFPSSYAIFGYGECRVMDGVPHPGLPSVFPDYHPAKCRGLRTRTLHSRYRGLYSYLQDQIL